MTFLKTDAKGIHEVSIPALTLNKGIIVVNGEITTDVANQFVQQLLAFALEKPTEKIKILITSVGGSVDAGMLMVDAIKTCQNEVWTYCLEKAYSMGALLTISGNRSFILPNSRIMIHKPWTTIRGNVKEIQEQSEKLQYYDDLLTKMLIERTHHSLDEIQDIIKEDHYFTAQEALQFGLVDDIVGLNHILESEV